jgi:2-polyprenyl-3-methyl-5-hydroxy-6-metoxy-1,4-benzoquinol methylase
MPDWEERISRETAPAMRAEHELRYELAAPLVADAALWCDLGCGNGVAAGRIARGRRGRTLLVDVAADALEQASREVPGDDVVTLQADLASEDGVARVRADLLEHASGGTRVVTCFETIEHLATFVPLVELVTELGERHGFTVLLSVPNDAFWSIENPHHQAMWGEGAFEELRRLLPADARVVRQVVLQGSALVPADGDPEIREPAVVLDPDGVPSHMLAVFGPEAARVAPGARVVQVDLEEQRRWERQRESDLAQLRWMTQEMEDWRRYIHELEAKLGLPLSGADAETQHADA